MKQTMIIRLDSQEHWKLKQFANDRGISINELLSHLVGALNDGSLQVFVQQPKISIMAQNFEYKLVQKAKENNNGQKE
jgi:hypothetical protein